MGDKISVIITSYNQAAFLDQRIKSVLQQSHKNIEVIILDDCSCDNSKEIIEAYRVNPLVKHIAYNEINSGSAFGQWQKGINLATGDLIWIAEGDDLCSPDFIRECLAKFETIPNLSLVCSRVIFISENGDVINHDNLYNPTLLLKDDPCGQNILKDFMLYENAMINTSAIIFKKHVTQGLDFGYIKSLKLCGDWAFWNSCLLSGGLGVIEKPLCFFRKHKSSASEYYWRGGWAFKEGIPLVVFFIQKLNLSLYKRSSIVYNWSKRLADYYLTSKKERKTGILFFKPFFFWIVVHLFLMLTIPLKLIRNR